MINCPNCQKQAQQIAGGIDCNDCGYFAADGAGGYRPGDRPAVDPEPAQAAAGGNDKPVVNDVNKEPATQGGRPFIRFSFYEELDELDEE